MASPTSANSRSDAHRDRRPRRPRQVDPGRAPVPRHRLAARRQAGRDQGDVRAARHAVRMGVPDGCVPVGARPGHHHRHRADLVQDAEARLHHHRRARPPRVHQEHDHRRLERRGRDHADRRQPGHPAAIAHPCLPAEPARHPADRRGGQQDGPGRAAPTSTFAAIKAEYTRYLATSASCRTS